MIDRFSLFEAPGIAPDTGSVSRPVFGKRRTSERSGHSVRLLRLETVRRELCALFDVMDGRNAMHPFVLVSDPVALLKIGERAIVSFEPETELYSLRETGAVTSIIVTASEERLLDHLLCLLTMPEDRMASLSASRAIQALVGERLADVERLLILQTLRRFGGSRIRAAAALGLSLADLRARLGACL